MSVARILVVDDSELTRTVIRRHLETAGFEVVEASDGVQGAVAALKDRPTAVVTDLEMPVMDGYQLARLLKNDPATRHLPVIILTSHGEATSRFWGADAGADAYVIKDEIEADLVVEIRRLVASAPPFSEDRSVAPTGPLDVLGRVARQLDRGLMEATLVNRVLQIGVGKGSFSSAVRRLLEFLDRLTDAELLGLGISDDRGTRLHLYRPEEATTRLDLDAVVEGMTECLGVPEREVLAVQLDGRRGEEGDGPVLAASAAVSFELGLHEAAAAVFVWPRDREAFQERPVELMTKIVPHAALVIDNVRLAENLWILSTHDELTGLLNHRAIVDRLRVEVARSRRYGNAMAVVLCDIDRFKGINDRYGHPVGDVVLRQVARRLRGSVRSSDVIGRYGGEEFMVVLPNAGVETARQAAQRLCDELAATPVPASTALSLPVTASFGVAGSDEVEVTEFEDLIVSLADSRLYEAKAAGRCRVKP